MFRKSKQYASFVKETTELKAAVDNESAALIQSLLDLYRDKDTYKVFEKERKLVGRIHQRLANNSKWNDIRVAYDLMGV